MRRGLKHVGWPARYGFFAYEAKVEGLAQVPEKRHVFLVLAEPRSLLLRRFVLQFLEILVAFFLFLDRWKLTVMFYELLKANAIDENHSRDVNSFRFHLSLRVQAAVLITFHIEVFITRPPAVLGRHQRLTHDLPGVHVARGILLLLRSTGLSQECGGSREHDQERSDSRFSKDFHC